MDRLAGWQANGADKASWLRTYRYAPTPARFSPVQQVIVQMVACGLSDKEIAHMLSISASTVKAHNTKTLRALGLLRRAQLVRYVFESGLFDPEAADRELSKRKAR
jgi:DNA-binding NarL/FixJ family response regulator